jgi:hypothetical protein
MKVFISHYRQEHLLAQAWRSLLHKLMPDALIWHSSDQSSEGGIGIGPWREWIRRRVNEADVVLALLTPESHERPWIIFEYGLAMGLSEKKLIVPITFGMTSESLHDVFRDMQTHCGDTIDGVQSICDHLIGRCPPPHNKEGLDIGDYISVVKEWEKVQFKHSLFHEHFHATKCARRIQGTWFALWTELFNDGSERLFEMDTLEIWTTENRLRFFGQGAKGEPYPMEGVCSVDGKIAMTYWSNGEIPICGTVLLELIGGHRIMEGFWQGFTTRKLHHRLALKKGRVVLARDKQHIEEWWATETGNTIQSGQKSFWDK